MRKTTDLSIQDAVSLLAQKTVVAAQFTRPTDTTAYAINDVVSDSTSAPTILSFRELYEFYVTGVTTAPTAGAIYYMQASGNSFEVLSSNISGGSGNVSTIRTGGTVEVDPSWTTLVKTSGTGDASLAISRRFVGGNLPLIRNSGYGYVTSSRLVINDATTTNAQFRLWLYKYSPTAINDNAAFTLLWANRHSRLGYIDYVCETGGTGSDSMIAVQNNLALRIEALPFDKKIYGMLTAKAAYTPTSGEKFYIELTVEQA